MFAGLGEIAFALQCQRQIKLVVVIAWIDPVSGFKWWQAFVELLGLKIELAKRMMASKLPGALATAARRALSCCLPFGGSPARNDPHAAPGFKLSVSRFRDSLVRRTASEPWPPAAVQSVTAAMVKLGVSANSIPPDCDGRPEDPLRNRASLRINTRRSPSGCAALTVSGLTVAAGFFRAHGIGAGCDRGRMRRLPSGVCRSSPPAGAPSRSKANGCATHWIPAASCTVPRIASAVRCCANAVERQKNQTRIAAAIDRRAGPLLTAFCPVRLAFDVIVTAMLHRDPPDSSSAAY